MRSDKVVDKGERLSELIKPDFQRIYLEYVARKMDHGEQCLFPKELDDFWRVIRRATH